MATSSSHPAGGRGVRRVASAVQTRDPRTGREVLILEVEADHRLASDGAIDSLTRHHDRYACRCDPRATPGGFCALCRGQVCAACLRRCGRCLAPMCPRHSRLVRLEAPARGTTTMCPSCARRERGAQLVRAAASWARNLLLERRP